MKPIKQTAYLPVNGDYPKCVTDDNIPEFYDTVVQEERFVLTSEQLNEYTQNVIKQALETAAEKAEIKQTPYSDWCTECGRSKDEYISSESITNTLEETFNKFKV